MTIWLGGSLVAVLDVRKSVERGIDHARACSERLAQITKLMIPAGLLTFVTGAALIGVAGMGNIAPRILFGALLTVVILILGGTMANPALHRFNRALAENDLPEAKLQIARFLKIAGMEQTIRFFVLVLMVLPF
jgi:hypothetical protein